MQRTVVVASIAESPGFVETAHAQLLLWRVSGVACGAFTSKSCMQVYDQH